jgi:hypothetical protein
VPQYSWTHTWMGFLIWRLIKAWHLVAVLVYTYPGLAWI